jgi:hypothetical protein
MTNAKLSIDKVFGERYAAARPDLVAAYMQTAVIDCGAAIIAQQLRLGLETVAISIAEANASTRPEAALISRK